MKLYDYFRSSAAYRVRIALNVKGLDYEQLPVDLRAGEQRQADYRARNPQQLVPALVLDGGQLLTQSLAICEYLDEQYPRPALLPGDAIERARVRSLALAIACEIHPLNNLRVLNYLTGPLGHSEADKLDWYRHWIALGFDAIESLLANDARTARFCHGDAPTLADICLAPQVFNARRFECDLAAYPSIMRISEACEALPAFRQAHPSRQPDAP